MHDYRQVGRTLEAMTASGAENGDAIRGRRVALGLSVSALAREAGVDRGRLAALEAGEKVRASTVGAVLSALTRLEAAPPAPKPTKSDPNLVTFRVSGEDGVDLTVEGPVKDVAVLEASVRALLKDIRAERDR